MSAIFRLLRVATVAAILFAALPAHAQQEVKTTPAKEVAANPQRFWARGVVFRDTLVEAPAKETITLAGARVYKFTTKTVGTCYADEKVLAALQALAPNREYIFGASVLSQQTGFFRKKTIYRVVVNGLVIPTQGVDDLPEMIETAIEQAAEENPLRQHLVILKQLIVSVQESITASAATDQIDRSQYLDPKSEYFDKLIQVCRRAVNDLETETKTPGREQLAQILAALVSLEEGALTPAAQPATHHTDNSSDTASTPPDEQPATENAPATESPVKTKSRHWYWPFGGSDKSAPATEEIETQTPAAEPLDPEPQPPLALSAKNIAPAPEAQDNEPPLDASESEDEPAIEESAP